MRKTKFISVLLVLGLVLSILPATNVYANTIGVSDTEDYGLMKAYQVESNPWENIVFVTPGDEVSLSFYWSKYFGEKEVEMVKYQWYKWNLLEPDKYTGVGFGGIWEKIDCKDKSYSFKPKCSEVYLCEAEDSEGYEFSLAFFVKMDMGLTTSQNIFKYIGNPGETANFEVNSRLINPNGKVTYEWYDFSGSYVEKLPFEGNRAKIKVTDEVSKIVCLIKYTEGIYTQIELCDFYAYPFDLNWYSNSLKGTDLVAVDQYVSIYSKDSSKVTWYLGSQGEKNKVASGVSTIKFDKPGRYIYVDESSENAGESNIVDVYKNGEKIELNKVVKGRVLPDVRECFFFTPEISGEYSLDILNNPNVCLIVMKDGVMTSYEALDSGHDSFGYEYGDIKKNKNAHGSIHMTAGETYKIVTSIFYVNEKSPQEYQLKLKLVKNECKHNSGFVTGEKAATFFTTGTTGDKNCGWCNAVLSKGKTIDKKKITLKAKALKKGVKLSWKKQSGIAGYQLRYATNKSFKKAKTVEVSKKSISKTLSKLTSKKKYYFAIRVYMKSGKKKVYGSWSKTVAMKIK